MAPPSRVPDDDDGRSAGGKIVRRRRIVSTPYDRPSRLNSTTQTQSPNWFKGLLSPAKFVAGKLLSSIWNPDTWSSSSSSSDSDSDDSQPLSADGLEDNLDQYESPHDGVELNEKYSSGIAKSISKDSQLAVRRSEVKHLIEQLLVLETFSRAEADRLIDIINSRVVDIFQREDAGLDDGTPDIHSRAVMEAKQWLEDSSKQNADRTLSFGKEHVRETEGGSPVDVAKSYMRDRPLWASPSVKLRELRSPSAVPSQLFTDATPYLKKDSLSAGSWNLHEEIRKVRSKATEEMLRARQSSRLDLSRTPLMASQSVELMNNSVSSDLGKTADGEHIEVLPSHKPVIMPEQNQDLEVIQTVGGESATFQSNHDARSEIESEQPLDTDPRLGDNRHFEVEGTTEFLSASHANGSVPRSSFHDNSEKNHNLGETEDGRSQGKSNNDHPADNNICHLSPETVEVPTVNETAVIQGGTRSNSRMSTEEASSPEHNAVNQKSDSVRGKQVGKKPGRYVRKGRGRGK